MNNFIKVFFLAIVLGLGACSHDEQTAAPEVPNFSEPHLKHGRAIWMNTCRNCHLLGVAGAPAISNYQSWAPRIEKGRDALYRSALNGVKKEGVWAMPPRGGNDGLSDDEVRDAVDFMVAAVQALHQ